MLSQIICGRIEGLAVWDSARVLTAFLPIQSEVDLRPLLMGGPLGSRVLGIPRTGNDTMSFDAIDLADPEALVVGEFGIAVASVRAPIDPTTVDLVLVPLLAFDAHGNRLGAGRAFYDRWLPAAVNAFRLGVAFSAQEIESVPIDAHDVRLHAVVTEKGLHACR